MVGEGDHHLGVGGQRCNGDCVMPLLGSTGHVEVDLDVILCLRALVTDKSAHHVAHRILRRRLASCVNLVDSDVVRIEATHTDTVDVDVVTVLGQCLEGNVNTSVVHVVGKIVDEASPFRGGGCLQVTLQRGRGLTLRSQARIRNTIVGGNLHRHLILLVGSGIVLRKPNLQNGVGGIVQNRHRQDGAGGCTGGERLRIEEQTTGTVYRHNGRVLARAVLERPVTGSGNLLNRPSLLRTVAEILLVVRDNVLQRKVLTQRVVGMLAVARIIDDDREINRLVAWNHHARGQHLVHAVQGGDGSCVHGNRLVEVQ